MNRISVLMAGLALGCGSDLGEGSIEFTVWGEEYIEQGIPAEEFEDGSSVRYDEFLVVLSHLEVAGGEGAPRRLARSRLYDLVTPGPHIVGTLEGLTAGAHREVSYSISEATAETVSHSSATRTQLDAMRDAGLRLRVSGTARSSEGEAFAFQWGFAGTVEYSDCVDVRGGQETRGVVVGDGTVEQHQITVHGDHLFYDDLASPEAVLRFASLALADADGDREVTLAELDQVRLASLSSVDGTYGVGAFDIDDLGAFVCAATQTIGHFDGEGHCVARER